MIGYNKNEIVGKMRERVILQNRVISQSDSGFQSETYSNIATLWTALDYKSGFEEEDADKIVTQQKINFTLRYNQNITTDSRFVYRDSLYQIEKIDISNDRRFVFCTGVYRSSYTGSYALTIDVASSINGIANLSANVNSLLYLVCQANASASTIATLTSGQQLIIDVASSVAANATTTANLTKVISIDSSMAANANFNTSATIVKYVQSSLNATATTTSVLEVISQGSVSVDAILNALGTVEAEIKRTVTLESSSSTSATTELNATLTKVIEASATATANTQSTAQLTIPVNAAANATANTTADATLSYTVNAELNATAQTTVDAQITRIISAEMTATAQTTVEAGIGVTFVSSLMAAGSVTNATIARTATLAASITGQGTTAAAITTVDNVAASVTGAATVTNATLTVIDADAQAFFNRVTAAGGTLTSTEQTAVNTLVIAMKANGTWTKMKAIYPMVGASAAACAQNLKSSSFTGTFTAGWTFASTGATPNGTSAFMDTALTPSISLSSSSSHFSKYNRTNDLVGDKTDGGTVPPIFFQFNFSLGNTVMGDVGTLITYTPTDTRGLFVSTRTTSSLIKLFRNNISLGSNTVVNTSILNIPIYIGARNPGQFYNTYECAFASLGDGLTDAEASNFYTDVQAFQTSLSRQI
jgi:SPP1 family predicted phage head-tail adaptor